MACVLITSIDYKCQFDICAVLSIIKNVKSIQDVFMKLNPDFINKKTYEKLLKKFSQKEGDIFFSNEDVLLLFFSI